MTITDATAGSEHSSTSSHPEPSRVVVSILAPFFALLVGALIRHYGKNIPVPYTVLLLLAGGIMGACLRAGWGSNGEDLGESTHMLASIDPHLLLHIFLPPLIFESAFSIDLNVFQQVKWSVLYMAVPGLLFTAALLAGFVNLLYQATTTEFGNCDEGQWTAMDGLLLGSILSATDPVAVVSLLKELGVKADVSTSIEGESLANDGTAIVVFLTFLSAVETGSGIGNFGDVLWTFFEMGVGGVALGVLCGAACTAFLGVVFNDALVEITITITAAYLTFFIAENEVHVSGVLAVMAMGMYLGSVGRGQLSPQVNHFLNEFWEVMAYIGNTLIFIIAGAVIMNDMPRLQAYDYGVLVVTYIILLVARIILCSAQYLFEKYVMRRKKVVYSDAVIAMWGGLRGAVGLAMALVVFESSEVCPAVGDKVLFQVAGIVVATVLVNGTSMKYILIYFGYDTVSISKTIVFEQAVKLIDDSATAEETQLQKDVTLNCTNWAVARDYYLKPPPHKVAAADKTFGHDGAEMLINEAKRRVLMVCKNSYNNQQAEGKIGHEATKFLKEVTDKSIDKGCLLDEWDRELVKALDPLHITGIDIRWSKTDLRRKKVLTWLKSPYWLLIVLIICVAMVVLDSLYIGNGEVETGAAMTTHTFEAMYTLFTVVFALEICCIRPWARNDLHAYVANIRTLLDLWMVVINLSTIGDGFQFEDSGFDQYSWLLRFPRFFELIINTWKLISGKKEKHAHKGGKRQGKGLRFRPQRYLDMNGGGGGGGGGGGDGVIGDGDGENRDAAPTTTSMRGVGATPGKERRTIRDLMPRARSPSMQEDGTGGYIARNGDTPLSLDDDDESVSGPAGLSLSPPEKKRIRKEHGSPRHHHSPSRRRSSLGVDSVSLDAKKGSSLGGLPATPSKQSSNDFRADASGRSEDADVDVVSDGSSSSDAGGDNGGGAPNATVVRTLFVRLWDDLKYAVVSRVNEIRRKMQYPKLRKGFDVTTGYINARHDALHLLSDFLQGDEGLVKVRTDLEHDIHSKQKILFRLQRAYPDIAASMATTQTAQAVLNEQEATLHHLYEEGMLEKGEVEKLVAALQVNQKQLRYDPPVLNTPDKDTLLRQVPWIQALDGDTFELLLEQFEQVLAPRGHCVVKQGSLSKDVYVLVRGIVEVVKKVEGGAPAIRTELGIGSYFGEVSWAMGRPAAASVVTACSCVLYRISGDALTNLTETSAVMRQSLWSLAGARVAEELLSGQEGINVEVLVARELINEFKVNIVSRGSPGATLNSSSVVSSNGVSNGKRAPPRLVLMTTITLRPGAVLILLQGSAVVLESESDVTGQQFTGPCVVQKLDTTAITTTTTTTTITNSNNTTTTTNIAVGGMYVRMEEGTIYMMNPADLRVAADRAGTNDDGLDVLRKATASMSRPRSMSIMVLTNATPTGNNGTKMFAGLGKLDEGGVDH